MSQGSHWNERDAALIKSATECINEHVEIAPVKEMLLRLVELAGRERERADNNARQIKGMKEIAAVFWSGRVQ